MGTGPQTRRIRRQTPHSRHRALAAITFAGLLAAAGCSSSTSTAQDSSASTTTPIKHLVVLYDENISFDHYFGTYPNAANTDGVPFHAAPGTPAVHGLTPDLLAHNPNLFNPQRLTPAQAMTCDQDHSYRAEQEAYDNGKMDQFVQKTQKGDCKGEYGPNGIVMDYYDGNTVTALWNYAQHYALNDNSFGTTFGPSTPGALEVTAAQTYGAKAIDAKTGNAVTDPNLVAAPGPDGVGSIIDDADPAYDDCSDKSHTTTDNLVSMTGRTIGDALGDKNISWGWFQGGFTPTGKNAAGYAVCGSSHTNLGGQSQTDYNPHHEPFQYYQSTANPKHLPPKSLDEVGHGGPANHQYDLSWFYQAAAAGKLPAVSYLKAANYQDGHAGYSDPIDEQHFVVDTIDKLQQSPDWKSTAVVLAYDDSDGWYDHVAGPVINGSRTPSDAYPACATTPALGGHEGRCGTGPRLPLLVVSPYARTNFVDHTLTDETSVVKFIEQNWSLPALGNGSSETTAGDMTGMFDFQHPQPTTLLLEPDGSEKH
ncbi:phospholipase C [Nocardia terpenica]|uniref:Phospholipase n=1 Tax=Nocardia terpenica TaxID=455432 RepID=A0A291RKV8_9NOCA|nr:alkaline phosphatase family protein [Nocardia terpenica]ATL67938.1 phospholipase [Nocardia terpenica]